MDPQLLLIVAALVAVALLAVWSIRRRRATGTTAPATGGGRLAMTTSALGAALRQAWGSGIEDRTWDEITEALIAADVGIESTESIVAGARATRPEDAASARSALAEHIRGQMEGRERSLHLDGSPAVVLVVGVNGTGKTTTIAKLAKRLTDQGRSVLVGAADTFRAAAGEQLRAWGDRIGVDVVVGQEGGDPASVAFDTVSAARARDADVVVIDTAGRLHGKKNLMAELGKIHRVVSRDAEVTEVLLVLDATSGQNGLAQVRQFAEAVPVTGLVLTKLDGTARGGIVVAVERELGVPVKLVGLGEGMDDLEPFDPDSFVTALLEGS